LKKKIISGILLLLITSGIILALPPVIFHALSYGSDGQPGTPNHLNDNFPEQFLSDDFWYDVKFLWFNDIADGHFFFKKGENPHEYKAVLEGRTKGFIGWLASHRIQRYTSTMELINTQNGMRLRSRRFLREVITGKKKEETDYLLDYASRHVTVRHSETGKGDSASRYEIPDGVVYEDLLSGYFNFKGGVFGRINKGDVFELDTISRTGGSKVKISIIDDNASGFKKLKKADKESFFIIRLEIGKELFGQKRGIVRVWSDSNLIPLTGQIVDVIGFGDVWGKIRTDGVH